MDHDGRKDLDFDELAAELSSRFAHGLDAPPSDFDFDALALRVFRHQHDSNTIYRAFCERRGIRPDNLSGWQDVPAVPTTAFRHLDLLSAGGEVEATFLTSGTTTGSGARGRHHVPRLSLYRAASVQHFRRRVLGEGGPTRFISLIPPAEQAPKSSLSYMVTAVSEELATRVDWVVDASGKLDVQLLRAALGEASGAGEPVALLGTALAFVHAVERLGDRPLPPLAPGSRVMETGGFKGLGREVTREELHRGIVEATAVGSEHIVNEYGMTELLSQLYEPVLSEGLDGAGTHVAPPWLRVHALDPTSLVALPDGEDGLLAFFDLANAGSVAHVLSQDIGSVRDGRVRLRGRLAGSEPRGCSRAMDELMTASRT